VPMSLPGKQSGQAPPTWLWLTAVIAVSAFAALVMYLDYHQKRDRHSVGQNKPEVNAPATASAKTNGKGKNLPGDGNKFDFYHLLPGLESIVNEEDAPKEAQPPASSPGKNDKKSPPIEPPLASHPTMPTTPASPEANQEYYLQVGAFQQYQAADRMKANLAMLGFKATIQRVDAANIGQVHRVRIGPFLSVKDMRLNQQRLNAANIPTIMVRSTLATK